MSRAANRSERRSSPTLPLSPTSSAASRTPLVSLVVPCHNEAPALGAFHRAVSQVIDHLPGVRFEIVCVNDGSTDDTLTELLALRRADARIRVIDFTRNFGKEAALSAGIDEARGDAVIPIDADLQDPPALIPVMIERWRNGAEVVLAKRTNRASDSLAKRLAAGLYYRVHNRLSEVKLPENVGDFRLMDRKVVDALVNLPERTRFMKGLYAWVGFRSEAMPYMPKERLHGSSSFNFWRLFGLATDGITAFTTWPLRFLGLVGALFAVMSIVYGVVLVAQYLLYGNQTSGWTTIVTALLFFSGVNLLSLGVMGEYVARIFDEVKGRPLFITGRRLGQARPRRGLPPEASDQN